jgi:hypothetical protein
MVLYRNSRVSLAIDTGLYSPRATEEHHTLLPWENDTSRGRVSVHAHTLQKRHLETTNLSLWDAGKGRYLRGRTGQLYTPSGAHRAYYAHLIVRIYSVGAY